MASVKNEVKQIENKVKEKCRNTYDDDIDEEIVKWVLEKSCSCLWDTKYMGVVDLYWHNMT